MLLAIESSCDETACAIFRVEHIHESSTLKELLVYEIISSQVSLHSIYGGVVPELASREHIRNLPYMVKQALIKNNLTFYDLTQIAVTTGPGLKGCLLVGTSYAKGLASSLSVPIIGINHLEAHILSAFEEVPIQEIYALFPALALLVSGGHTQLIRINNIGSYEILASTSDDAAGEAFDKIGTLLGFSYPAGRAVSHAASKGTHKHVLPLPVQDDNGSFSFSGLKTAANLYIKKKAELFKSNEDRQEFINDFSHSLEKTIIESLVSKTNFHLEQAEYRSIIVSGGVAANNLLRERIKEIAIAKALPFFIPRPSLCTDNATMIGIAAIIRQFHMPTETHERAIQVRTKWNVSEVL